MFKELSTAALCVASVASAAYAQPSAADGASGEPFQLLNRSYDYSGYEAEVVQVIDAATVRLNIHLWPGRILTTDVTAPGIETPDSTTHQCEQQTEFADAAQSSVRRNFPVGSWVYVNDVTMADGQVFADVVGWQGSAYASVSDILLSRPGRWAVDAQNAPFDWCFGQE